MKLSQILLAPLFVASYVSAHGRVEETSNAAGQTFKISKDDNAPNNTPIRRSNEQDPIINFAAPSLTCGAGAKIAPFSMNVQPGENVKVYWKNLIGGNWAHEKGPLITYLADCGGPCSKFQHNSNTRFFKIHQLGKLPGTSNWYQEDLMKGLPANFKVPNNLAPGEYLARTEVIALHRLDQDGNVEFYPGCIQLKVGGNGTGHFGTEGFVNFPGEYKRSDNGFTLKEANSVGSYDFPGGPYAKLVVQDPSSSPSSNGPPLDPASVSTQSHKLPLSSSKLQLRSTPSPQPSRLPSTSSSGNVDYTQSTSLPTVSLGGDLTDTIISTPKPTISFTYGRRQLGHIMR